MSATVREGEGGREVETRGTEEVEVGDRDEGRSKVGDDGL